MKAKCTGVDAPVLSRCDASPLLMFQSDVLSVLSTTSQDHSPVTAISRVQSYTNTCFLLLAPTTSTLIALSLCLCLLKPLAASLAAWKLADLLRPPRLLPPLPSPLPPASQQHPNPRGRTRQHPPQQTLPQQRQSVRLTSFGQHALQYGAPTTRPRLHQHPPPAPVPQRLPREPPQWPLIMQASLTQNVHRPLSPPEQEPAVAFLLGLESWWLSHRLSCQIHPQRQSRPRLRKQQRMSHPGFQPRRQRP